MNTSRRHAVFVTVAMFSSAALAYLGKPTRYLTSPDDKPDLEVLFPKQFGDWRVATNLPVVLPAPDVQDRLDRIYNQVLSRTYVNSANEYIMLSVAYGGDQSDGTRSHRPEVCYPAQGFQITESRIGKIDAAGRKIGARQLMAVLGGRQEPITYWMVVGGMVATSNREQKMAEIRYGLRGLIPDGLLVRVSSIDHDMNHGHATQARFVSDLAKALPAKSALRVFGDLPSANSAA